jgi:predicted NACHT family NTPase
MPRKTLKASKPGIGKVRQAFHRYGWTQDALAEQVNLKTRQPIGNLLAGKAIDRHNFIEICTALDLNWEEIAESVLPAAEPDSDRPDLEVLVAQARDRAQADIEKRCGWMKVLDMTQRIGLGAIYTDVNILEKIAGKTRREIVELMQGCSPENFDRFWLGQVRERRVDGLEAVATRKQLMILGRPGAGKTTFLKRLATLCNQGEQNQGERNRGEFLARQVPVFVSLKEFAETIDQPGLLDFMAHYFVGADALDEAIAQVKQILMHGRGLVLLDGLDEVLEKDHDRVLREIREFAQRYDSSHIVITCRIAAREYVFEQFTEVEMADFDDGQIQAFADKWFKAKEPEQVDGEGRSIAAQLFWQALEEQEPIKELAANPLLLTLLCLEFEESSEFPQSRAELYERGLNILLSKWDGQRRIKRDEVYKRLPIKRKEMMLGHLAMHTFDRGEYFFRAHVAERQIGQYIQNLPDASTDPDSLLVDSRAVLKSIESQHGLLTERATDIYSFSHLTFHEYFTAKNILDTSASDAQQKTLDSLAEHVNEKRWREVFLLVVERIENADYLLTAMLKRVNAIVLEDEDLQRFLNWSNEKATSVSTSSKPVAVKAFYFIFHLSIDIEIDAIIATYYDTVRECSINSEYSIDVNRLLGFTLDTIFRQDFAIDLVYNLDYDYDYDRDYHCNYVLPIDRALAIAIIIAPTITTHHDLAIIIACAITRAIDIAITRAIDIDPKFQQKLQTLRDQLQSQLQDNEQFKQWWETQGVAGTAQLRATMIEHRNIGYDWQFSPEQKDKLEQYHNANLLLADCLDRGYLSIEARQRIENGMLMPIG